MLVDEEIVYFGECVGAYLFDEFLKLLRVRGGELPGMAVDGLYKLGRGLTEECIELF